MLNSKDNRNNEVNAVQEGEGSKATHEFEWRYCGRLNSISFYHTRTRKVEICL